MPKLKQLACSVAVGPNKNPMREYNTKYGDGFVKTFLCVPSEQVNFSIHLTSSGYIAPGLAMFVFIDGVLHCNRNQGGLVIPDATTSPEQTQIDFRVRQKEDKFGDGKWIGREWSFAQLRTATNAIVEEEDDSIHGIGTIEVIVLRCYGDERDQTRNQVETKVSEAKRQNKLKNTSIDATAGQDDRSDILSGGLFDGPSDELGSWLGENRVVSQEFGHDGAREPYDWTRYLSPGHDHLVDSPLARPAYESHLAPNRDFHARGDPLRNWNEAQETFARHNITGRNEHKYEIYPAQRRRFRRGDQDSPQRSEELRGDLQREPLLSSYVPPPYLPMPYRTPSTPPSQQLRMFPLTPSTEIVEPDERNIGTYRRYPRNPAVDYRLKPGESGITWLPERYTRERFARPGSPHDAKNATNVSTASKGSGDNKSTYEHVRSPQATAADSEKSANWGTKNAHVKTGIDKWISAEKKESTWGEENQNNNTKGSNENGQETANDWGVATENKAGGQWDNQGNVDNPWHDNSNPWNERNPWNGEDNRNRQSGSRKSSRSSWAGSSKAGSAAGKNEWYDREKAKPQQGSEWAAKSKTGSAAGSSGRYEKENAQLNAGKSKPSRTEKEHGDFDPTVIPVKPYWSGAKWAAEKNAEFGRRKSAFLVPEEPLRRVPEAIAQEQSMSHQVQSGKGALYMSAVRRPRYLDSIKRPYAVFIFEYRSKEMLEKLFNEPVKESKEPIRKRLDAMSKEEVIERYLKAKRRAAPALSEDDSLPSSPVLSAEASPVEDSSAGMGKTTKVKKTHRHDSSPPGGQRSSHAKSREESKEKASEKNEWTWDQSKQDAKW